MNLRRLSYFIVLAEELHFGRAAARLNMAQPPLSQQIQLLERELGVKLFHRSTREVGLTSAGRLLYPEAQDLVRRAGAIERSAEQIRTGEGGVLRLGFVDSASYGVLPKLIRAHRSRWPEVTYELHSLSSDEQAIELQRGTIDLGIARAAPTGELETSTVLEERLLLAVSDDDQRSRQRATSLKTMTNDSIIGFDRTVSPTLHAELTSIFAGFGMSYEPVIEATEYTTILGLVAAGEGVAVVPASVQTFQPPSIRYVGLRDSAARTALVFLRRVGDSSALLTRALSTVDEAFPTKWIRPVA